MAEEAEQFFSSLPQWAGLFHLCGLLAFQLSRGRSLRRLYSNEGRAQHFKQGLRGVVAMIHKNMALYFLKQICSVH